MISYARRIALLLSLTLCLLASAQAEVMTIPTGVTGIREGTFRGDTSIDQVVLPEGVTSIGSLAFAESSLTRITIPSTVTSISADAFDSLTTDRLTFVVTEDSDGEAAVEALTADWTAGTCRILEHCDGISANTLIEMVKACIGSPYNGVSGSRASSYSEITTKGTDCSGLIYYTFKAMNYKAVHGSDIPYGSNSLWKSACYRKKGWLTSETWNDVVPGDLLFKSKNTVGSSDYGDVYHVGLVVAVTPTSITVVHASDYDVGIISTTITNNSKWNLYGHMMDVDYADVP